MKKMIMMIILGIILSSCGELRYGIQKTINDTREERELKEIRKKNSSGAILDKKYTKGIEVAISDVYKRNVNKKTNFNNIVILIPENTEINIENGTIVDLKTGYGLPIYFAKDNACYKSAFVKKVNGEYYRISYYGNNIGNLAQKIIKANDFKNTCN